MVLVSLADFDRALKAEPSTTLSLAERAEDFLCLPASYSVTSGWYCDGSAEPARTDAESLGLAQAWLVIVFAGVALWGSLSCFDDGNFVAQHL